MLPQVNAAKRHNDARARPPPSAAPRAPPVPRLPLTALSRAGSVGGGLQGSSRQAGQENATLLSQRQQQHMGTPRVLGSARPGSSRQLAGSALAGDSVRPSLLLPLQGAEGQPQPRRPPTAAAPQACAHGDGVAAGLDAGSLRSSGKLSRVTLVQLLSSPSSSWAGAGAHSQAASPRSSTGFTRTAASAASASASAAAAVAAPCARGGGSGCAAPQVAPGLQAGAAGPQPPAPQAVPEPLPQGRRIPVRPASPRPASARAPQATAAASAAPARLLAGGSSAPPLQHPPGSAWRAESTLRHAAGTLPLPCLPGL